jgi:hypothetical protein
MNEMTQEQRDAWRRKVHSVDAALKLVVESPVSTRVTKPQHGLHLVPKLHLPHTLNHGHSRAA